MDILDIHGQFVVYIGRIHPHRRLSLQSETMSDPIPQLLQDAIQAHKARHHEEAATLYKEILSVRPKHLEASFLYGILAAQTDQEDLAITLLQDVTRRDPKNFEAHRWLAGVLSFRERHDEAEKHARAALHLRPDQVDAIFKLATALFGQSKYSEAGQVFGHIIRAFPTQMDAYSGLASTYLKMGDPSLARNVLREAVHLSPNSENLLKLGEVCLACEDAQEALDCAERVLQKFPGDVSAIILKARAYRNGQMEQGEDEALAQLRSVSPDHPLGHTLYGRRLQSLGEFDQAEREFRLSIELAPNQGVAYYGVTAGRRLNEGDRDFVHQMKQVALEGKMIQDELAHLHFALGKALDNLGEYGEAMEHFDQGNRLMRELRMGTRRYDRDASKQHVDGIIKLFTKSFIETQLEKSATQSKTSPEPIIVAGIMRSGTTLAEQILTCHPQIGGGGEQAFWRPAESLCVNYRKGVIDQSVLRKKAKEYSDLLAGLAPGYEFVTDKNPANRLVYGLIHLAFPSSRIIHMRRNPVDVAISIYTTLIRTGAPFVGNREDIVYALQEHERLVDHWREVLPSDRFLEVHYESLVTDRENETRRMIEFCGLPWDDACMRPEDNLRTVVTPSFWQVRQPVYSGSLNRWKRYEPWLGAFKELVK